MKRRRKKEARRPLIPLLILILVMSRHGSMWVCRVKPDQTMTENTLQPHPHSCISQSAASLSPCCLLAHYRHTRLFALSEQIVSCCFAVCHSVRLNSCLTWSWDLDLWPVYLFLLTCVWCLCLCLVRLFCCRDE